MEESREALPITLQQVLHVVLNPIGSLALCDRLNEDGAVYRYALFDILCPRAVQLIQSENGFRVIECFLNSDDINVRLAEYLSEEWSRLKEVMGMERGRNVCKTLLKRKMKAFANRIIEIVPKDWWLKNACALPVLITAITICDVEVAKEFIADEQMEADLCDSPEGLYCVLKIKGKWRDQPGWSDSFSRLILLKARSTEGSEALVQAIVYGNYLVKEMVEVLCCRRESFDDSTTVTLIIRVMEKCTVDVKGLIVKCLCEPDGNPIIRQIRNSTQFDAFKRACDSYLTVEQRKRLDDHLAAFPMTSVVDACLQTLIMSRDETNSACVDGQNKKRRAEPAITSQSAAKKSREEVAESQPSTSKTTVPNATVSEPAKTTVPTAPKGTVPEPSKTTVPPADKDTVPPVFMITVPPVPVNTVLVLDTVPSQPPALSSTIPPCIPSPVANQTTSRSAGTVAPSRLVDAVALQARIDPGNDVINRAMSDKYRFVILKLNKSPDQLSPIIFTCINNGLLALMMDERGSEVIKWFLANGSVDQKGTIENRVFENLEDLVTNGGYGRSIVQIVMEQCASPEKKKEFKEKFARAMQSVRDSQSPTLVPVDNRSEIEQIVSLNGTSNDESAVYEEAMTTAQPTVYSSQENKVATPAETTTIPNAAPSIFSVLPSKISFGPKDSNGENYKQTENASPLAAKIVTRHPVSQQQWEEIHRMFTEVIDRRLISEAGKLCDDEIKDLIAVGKINGGGVAQEFIDLLLERMPVYKKTITGRSLLKSIFTDKELRPYLVAPIASNLHLISDYWGKEILGLLLFPTTCESFYRHCFLGNEDSPFVKFFRSDANKYEVVQTGMKIASAYSKRFRELILPLRPAISETEKGRRFIDRLDATYGRTELYDPIPINSTSHATPTVVMDAIDGTSNNESIAKEKSITTPQPTVSSSQENTVAAQGETKIVAGQPVSHQQSKKIREMFAELDEPLRRTQKFGHGWLSDEQKEQLVSVGMTTGDGVAQEFIDQVKEKLSTWASSGGRDALEHLFKNEKLRPHLVAPAASDLHLFCSRFGKKVLTLLLELSTRDLFFHHCFDGNENSPFVKFFDSDENYSNTQKIGKRIAIANMTRFHALMQSLCKSLSKSENGRKFIVYLKKPPPCGFGWEELLTLPDSARPTDEANKGTSNESIVKKEAITAPQPTASSS